MKKGIFGLILTISALFLTGCGSQSAWNGVYTNGTNYSIMIYTKDSKVASIMVKQEGENFTFYPVQYDGSLTVNDNTLTMVNGEKLIVTKNEDQITIKIDSEDKGVWADIEGVYTKSKNIKRFNQNQF